MSAGAVERRCLDVEHGPEVALAEPRLLETLDEQLGFLGARPSGLGSQELIGADLQPRGLRGLHVVQELRVAPVALAGLDPCEPVPGLVDRRPVDRALKVRDVEALRGLRPARRVTLQYAARVLHGAAPALELRLVL